MAAEEMGRNAEEVSGDKKDRQEQTVPTRTRMALLGLDPSSERARGTEGLLGLQLVVMMV